MSEKEAINYMNECRIGVFVCHCGTNINGVLDCKALSEYASHLPNVVHSEDNMYTCSEVGLNRIKSMIEEKNLERVIVASCTPRTHEHLFRSTCNEAGLNPYLFQFVNIRDQCSWVHADEPEKAQDKARDLIRMGVAKATNLEPLDIIKVEITPKALVIGGGIAGMTAAKTLGNQGFEVILVEKEKELGGNLNNLHKLFPSGVNSSEVLKIRDEVKEIHNITILTSSIIKNVDGFIGNYVIDVESEGRENQYKVGTIIVAIGSEVLQPFGLYNYNGENIITQLELEKLLKANELSGNNIVMIQCVGSRTDDRVYCSNICCRTAIQNSMILKDLNPNSNIFILYRDINTPGVLHEQNYRKAREKGIIFIRYSKNNPPKVNQKDVKVYNTSLGKEMSIPYNYVVLSTPMIARDGSKTLAQMLKVPQDENGFFLEAHVKLRPVDFATDGIFVCGSAKWPEDISSSISQAYAAASRASTILSKTKIEVEGATAYIDKDLCIGCEVCIKLCPYSAIYMDENEEVIVNEVLCKGCGVCGASCIKNAITIKHFTNDQIMAEIIALGGE
jgi:heterodisulfide reductase subunit A